MIDPYDLLREVLASGRSFDDPRVRYVEVQLSRQLLFDIAKCLEEVNVVESIRPERLSRFPWLVVLGVVAVAVVAVGILAAIVVKGV